VNLAHLKPIPSICFQTAAESGSLDQELAYIEAGGDRVRAARI
jgi:hypothetical protein